MTESNQTELNKIVREMQNTSDAKAKQSPLFNQKAADLINQSVKEKLEQRKLQK